MPGGPLTPEQIIAAYLFDALDLSDEVSDSGAKDIILFLEAAGYVITRKEGSQCSPMN